MKKQQLCTLLVLGMGLFAHASSSLAQPGSLPPGPAQQAEYHSLSTLDRLGSDSAVGVDIAYTSTDSFDDVTVLRFDLNGRYVLPSGTGVAVNLPIAQVFADDDDETAMGSLGLTAFHAVRQGNVQTMVHAGVLLPTADDDVSGFLANLVAGFGRLTDFAATYPDTLTARLGISPQLDVSPNLFVRADLGIDALFLDDASEDNINLLRINVAAGLVTESAIIAVELVNLTNLDIIGDEDDDSTLHTLAFSARLKQGKVRPHASLVVPLDEGVGDLLDFVFMAGVEAPLDI